MRLLLLLLLSLPCWGQTVLLSGMLTGKVCGEPVESPGGSVLIMLSAGVDEANVFDIEARIERSDIMSVTGWSVVHKSRQPRVIDGVEGTGWRVPISVVSRAQVSAGVLRACISVGQTQVATAIVVQP